MVDGAARPGTVVALSHWAGAPTPEVFRRDLSTGIVLAALAHPEVLPAGLDVATVDHVDEDGLIALGLLCVAGLAADHGPLLLEAARVGDFGVVTDRKAALLSFALASLWDPGRSPLAALRTPQRPAEILEVCALAAAEALRLLPDLAADPGSDRFAPLWQAESTAYDASVAALAGGEAALEEYPEVDLAVVRVGSGEATTPTAWAGRPLHPAAVHSAARGLRVVTVAGDRIELRYRYESWVRLVSGPVRPRVDLSGVAEELTAAEERGARWVFDGAGATTGALRLAGPAPSTVGPDRFLSLVRDRLAELDTGPPAWDPTR